MARRRIHRAPKRSMSWEVGVGESLSTATAANVDRQVPLFVPLEDHQGATVTRIVGSVTMGLQNNAVGTDIQMLAWGIYWAGSGTVGDMQMSPTATLDQESNHWLHLRHLHLSTRVSDRTQFGWQHDFVDIRVQRKVAEGEGLILAFESAFAYESIASLRLLLKHT